MSDAPVAGGAALSPAKSILAQRAWGHTFTGMARDDKTNQYERSYHRSERRVLIYKLIIAAVLLAMAVGAALFFSQLGPRRVRVEEAVAVFPEAEAVRMRQTAKTAFERFLAVESAGTKPSAQDLENLVQAVSLQKELIRKSAMVPNVKDKEFLETLLVKLDFHRGEQLAGEMSAAQTAADTLIQAGQIPEALGKLRQAEQLQREIDTNHARSPRRNPSQAIAIGKQIRELAAEPLYRESLNLEKEAEALAAAKKYQEAVVKLRQSMAALKSLISSHRESRYADLSRLRRLENEVASLNSSTHYDRLLEIEAEASGLEKEGRYEEAAAKLKEVAQAQRTINQNYPGSTHASRERLDNLETHRQVLLSRSLVEGLHNADKTLDEALQSRRVGLAQQLAGEIQRDLRLVQSRYNKHPVLESILPRKAQFLVLMGEGLGPMQERYLGSLLPVPGMPGRSLLTQEVSQSEYEKIMGQNPSKSPGANLPVEAVTWDEAVEFCQRLGWVLARPVRLPNREEFLTATGPVQAMPLEQWSWNSLNSRGVPQTVKGKAPNANGFYDLLGNVAEWGVASASAGEAVVFGGSCRDNPDALLALPVENRPKNERNRFRGFRVVVEDLVIAAPPTPGH